MKQRFLLSAIGVLFVCFACSNRKHEKTTGEMLFPGTKDNSIAEKNLAASHIVNEAFQTGDTSRIDEAIASDFVDHTDRGDLNRDSLKAMIIMTHKQFPDMKMEVIKELADDEYVFSMMRWTGTSNGQMGVPKGPFEMKAIEVVRFKDGKGVEHWTYMQPADLMKMMPQQTSAQ